MPQPPEIYAGEMLARAEEFLTAFDRLNDGRKPELLYPSYTLLAHSLELYLKSFLLTCGVRINDLKGRKFGHNLKKLLAACESRGLPTITYFHTFLLTVHEMNRDSDFRYPSGYNLSMPSPIQCLQIMKKLKLAIHNKVGPAVLSAQLQFASDTRHMKNTKVRWSR